MPMAPGHASVMGLTRRVVMLWSVSDPSMLMPSSAPTVVAPAPNNRNVAAAIFVLIRISFDVC